MIDCDMTVQQSCNMTGCSATRNEEQRRGIGYQDMRPAAAMLCFVSCALLIHRYLCKLVCDGAHRDDCVDTYSP